MIAIGALVVGLVLGYMLAMAGVYEILNHIQIETIIVDFNETKLVDLTLCKINGTYC